MHCAYFAAGRCRSCGELAVPYAAQLAAKQAHAVATLAACDGIAWLAPVPSRPTGFRNKAKMVVGGTAAAPVLGILDAQQHGVDLTGCPLYPDALAACFPALAAFITQANIAPYDIPARRGELKYLLLTLAEHSGDLMLRFVLRSQEPLARIRKHLPALRAALPQLRVVSANLQPEHKAVLEGEQELLLTQEQTLTMQVNGLPLHLRPQSFFQTNTEVAAALYRQAREWVEAIDPPALWDLFCGVGGFALHCANGQREVTGIETSRDAIASAERSRDALGLANVRFAALDATRFALDAREAPPLVIVNPPRRGIGADLCRFLDASAARSLVYSSCNSESLARDLAMLPGFRATHARVLDMFPHTRHYEVIVLLERGSR
ncbi:23S rRNA (uracil(747)-C(5))-methyltransferase RlmC [Chiayiivirga flava]|uniref:23S rRNA (uracil(747)-C(5))-methyltransferase RlmC n=1 Tax=Chiayiivirga flava TaxID=659595 RepID=A0A7W8D4Q5_9GAMM|nr:23S rRNA (uracil(747)-C(5))-methyltransferase RlmC [Chiayiivirga flava]MBB5206642.1 23S rRNA (uracil747-C5)-methyltransferase [Chiayiivirga flava]